MASLNARNLLANTPPQNTEENLDLEELKRLADPEAAAEEDEDSNHEYVLSDEVPQQTAQSAAQVSLAKRSASAALVVISAVMHHRSGADQACSCLQAQLLASANAPNPDVPLLPGERLLPICLVFLPLCCHR